MSIVHVNIPAFGIAVERLLDPRLRHRPVALAVGSSPRAPLALVSSEAYRAGIRAGDRARDALKLEPALRIVPQNPPLYERAQRKLDSIVDRFTPLYEAVRLGSFNLDMSGTEGLFGPAPDAGGKIYAEIRRVLNLEATLGVAKNKLVSRIAAKVIRPRGLCDVFPGSEAIFLAPLELEYLPKLGALTEQRLLQDLGIRCIRDLAAIPAPVLLGLFGRRGERLKAQAQGIDEEPVRPQQRQAILVETATLPQETNDEPQLLARLWRLTESLAAQLRGKKWVAGKARLEALYLDREWAHYETKLKPPTHFDFTLFQALMKVWPKFLARRVGLKSLTLKLSELQAEFAQQDFLADGREERMLKSLDRLREKYGKAVVRTGRALE